MVGAAIAGVIVIVALVAMAGIIAEWVHERRLEEQRRRLNERWREECWRRGWDPPEEEDDRDL
jgi:hypothetical protein